MDVYTPNQQLIQNAMRVNQKQELQFNDFQSDIACLFHVDFSHGLGHTTSGVPFYFTHDNHSEISNHRSASVIQTSIPLKRKKLADFSICDELPENPDGGWIEFGRDAEDAATSALELSNNILMEARGSLSGPSRQQFVKRMRQIQAGFLGSKIKLPKAIQLKLESD